MVITNNQVQALIRLFLFHTKTSYSVKEIREMAEKNQVLFTSDEISDEIEANDLAENMG